MGCDVSHVAYVTPWNSRILGLNGCGDVVGSFADDEVVENGFGYGCVAGELLEGEGGGAVLSVADRPENILDGAVAKV